MRVLGKTFIFSLALAAPLIAAPRQALSEDRGVGNVQPVAEQLYALANQTRAQSGAGPLQWDPALAAAALYHCRWMAEEGPIAHRYGGEPDLAGRAGQAGAHFSLIEENVAVSSSADRIHSMWMQSPGHRANLLNPEVDRVGVAVVESRGMLYAVADYARDVQTLTALQVEARVAQLIKVRGISIVKDPSLARRACTTSEGIPGPTGSVLPGFVMRWQGADLGQLPKVLADKLDSGRYRRAAIGSCPAQDMDGAFTAYRMAVLLYFE